MLVLWRVVVWEERSKVVYFSVDAAADVNPTKREKKENERKKKKKTAWALMEMVGKDLIGKNAVLRFISLLTMSWRSKLTVILWTRRVTKTSTKKTEKTQKKKDEKGCGLMDGLEVGRRKVQVSPEPC